MKKRIFSIALTVLMLFSLCACSSAGDADSADNSHTPYKAGDNLTMGTGGSSGTYYAFGNVLTTYMSDRSGSAINVVSTDGSAANIYGIDDNIYQLATVQSDVMAYAWDGVKSFEEDGAIDSFRVIGGLYAECVQIITLDPSIKTVADLRGRNVSIGAAGSGVYFNAIDVLGAYGLSEDDINAQYLSFAESTDAMKDNKIDAAFIVAGAPTTAVVELAATNQVYLVSIEDDIADKLLADCPYYTKYTIPAGTYKGVDTDTATVSIMATMIVAAGADEDLVYDLTAAIFENKDAITAAHAKGAELSVETATTGMAAPFHPGAAKYYAEKGITVPTE